MAQNHGQKEGAHFRYWGVLSNLSAHQRIEKSSKNDASPFFHCHGNYLILCEDRLTTRERVKLGALS